MIVIGFLLFVIGSLEVGNIPPPPVKARQTRGHFYESSVTPGCQIQESQGLQLVLVQMIIRTQQSAIVNVQLFQTNLFQYKGGLCTSHATWYGSQI